MRNLMVGGLAVHKQIQRAIFVVIGAMICAALAIPFQARAETPLAAFCADNTAESRSTLRSSLIPARNRPVIAGTLAGFASRARDIDALPHIVIDKVNRVSLRTRQAAPASLRMADPFRPMMATTATTPRIGTENKYWFGLGSPS